MGQNAELSSEELQRYSRQLILPEIGNSGQKKLKDTAVLLVGTGGLGSPAAIYLAAAGVGRIGLADSDTVELNNLHRQIIHATADIGRPKIASAAESLRGINPNVEIVSHEVRLAASNAINLFKPYDIILDCTDNFPARYLINDACVLLGKPDVYGSIFRFEGQASVFDTARGPCYRCLYREPPPPDVAPPCAEAGVLGVVPGLVGLIQAAETIKLILGKGDPLIGRLLLIDLLSMKFREMKLPKDPDCPICGKKPTIRSLVDTSGSCTPGNITATELKKKFSRKDEFILLDVREPHEFDQGHIPGAVLMPVGRLADNLQHFNRHCEIIVYCRTGGRSSRAAEVLRKAGFKNVTNLTGGILAWEKEK